MANDKFEHARRLQQERKNVGVPVALEKEIATSLQAQLIANGISPDLYPPQVRSDVTRAPDHTVISYKITLSEPSFFGQRKELEPNKQADLRVFRDALDRIESANKGSAGITVNRFSESLSLQAPTLPAVVEAINLGLDTEYKIEGKIAEAAPKQTVVATAGAGFDALPSARYNVKPPSVSWQAGATLAGFAANKPQGR